MTIEACGGAIARCSNAAQASAQSAAEHRSTQFPELNKAADLGGPPSPPASVASGTLEPIYARFAEFDKARSRMEELANQPLLDPSTPEFFQQSRKQMIEILALQGSMGNAALGVELVSKTIEVGSSGIRTLAQTQM